MFSGFAWRLADPFSAVAGGPWLPSFLSALHRLCLVRSEVFWIQIVEIFMLTLFPVLRGNKYLKFRPNEITLQPTQKSSCRVTRAGGVSTIMVGFDTILRGICIHAFKMMTRIFFSGCVEVMVIDSSFRKGARRVGSHATASSPMFCSHEEKIISWI